jgi:hypothetical protein
MAPLNHNSVPRRSGLFLVPALSSVQRPGLWKQCLRALELEPEDLLAIPLCLVLGFAFSLYSLGPSGLTSAVLRNPAAASDNGFQKVVSVLSVPAAAVRQLFS